MSTPSVVHKHLDNGMWYGPQYVSDTWYVILESTASHEGSCDADSTKEDTETAATTGSKSIEEKACELVTIAIQNAVVELQNEVKIIRISCVKLFDIQSEDLESAVSMENKEIPGNLSVVGGTIAGVSGVGSLQFSDILQKDAFLVFRSLCKLSMKNISNETDPR